MPTADRDQPYPPLKPPLLFTAEEAARLLRVKVTWLQRQAARRQIPFVKLAGTYRFTAEQLAAIVRANEVKPTADGPSRPRAVRRTSPRNTSVTPLRARPRPEERAA